jgi:polyhydroxyalkanoate synthase subunit PhaC
MIDLMAWNADGTRMPWRMHTEYLYRLYLDNELATNRFKVGGKLIRLSDISVPMFVVGTEADHVRRGSRSTRWTTWCARTTSPSCSPPAATTPASSAGPVHPKRHYRMRTRRLADPHLAPEEWMEVAAPKHSGSWWPAWQRWLADHSSGKTKPPATGAPGKGYRIIEDAPGQYVRQR